MIDRIPFGRGGTFKKAAALGGKTQNADAVILLGTLPYMSPEQSRGEEVDSRSDIFSFGGVLYEMLTGVQPFLKDSAVETAHAILNEAPAPVSNYLDRTPVVLPHTVRKMLAKDPDRRYQRVCDVRIDLEELIGDSSQPSTESQAPMATSQWRQVLPWLLVGILVITVAMLVLIQSDEAPEGRGTVRFQIPPPEPELRVSAPMVSPDGKKIAFIGLDESGKRSLWIFPPIGRLFSQIQSGPTRRHCEESEEGTLTEVLLCWTDPRGEECV